MQDNYEIIYGDLEIEEVDQRAYIRLKRYEGILEIIKRGIFTTFFIVILYFSRSEIKLEVNYFDNLGSKGQMLTIIGFVIIFRVAFAYLGRFAIYLVVKRAYEEELSRINEGLEFEKESMVSLAKEVIKSVWRTIKSIILPDFEAAKFFKEKIRKFAVTYVPHKHKEEAPDQPSDVKCNNAVDKDNICIQCNDSIKFMTKFYVKFSNWCNLMGAMILVIVIIPFGVFENLPARIVCIFTISIWLLFRMVSRTWEIARAFYNDVVRVGARIFNYNDEKTYLHSWKNSYIRKPLRISLAIHSLLELVLMFTCAYILTFTIFGSQLGFQVEEGVKSSTQEVNSVVENEKNDVEKEMKLSKVHDYIVEKKVYEFVVYAISICFFNISYINYGFFWWNVLHVWQVMMSMVLIILSIAAYLGNNDDMYQRESEFFARTLQEVNKRNPWIDFLKVVRKFVSKFKK
ncbi:hypothetical protein R3O67_00010 [Bacillus cereus]|uniref:hypothetical protein n=1 Tax=Bacillus cereus TaxID=1396 RepID=UPI00307AE6D9